MLTERRFKTDQQVRIANEKEQINQMGDVMLRNFIGKTVTITKVEHFDAWDLIELEGFYNQRFSHLRFKAACDLEEFE